MSEKYNSWPLGKLPEEFQRHEPEALTESGYEWDDPRDIISIFEKKVAVFAGCKYAIAVDCCSNGLFLCLKYIQANGEYPEHSKHWPDNKTITIPKYTYVSVPMQIKHAGFDVKFEDTEWSGGYGLNPTRIIDAAVMWRKNMYAGFDALQVVSFQLKKRVPIGKGGMILTDDKKAAEWIRLASYDGRDLTIPYTHSEHIKMLGYHMYMTPEDAARGIMLMDEIPDENEDSGNHETYTDLSKLKFF